MVAENAPENAPDDFDGLSFDDAVSLALETGAVNASELSVKNMLVGLPFIITSVEFQEGTNVNDETGEMKTWVSCKVLTKDGQRLSFIDGSTGVHDQIKALHYKMPETVGKPLVCMKGLRRSDYTHPEHGPSTTFYLDTK
jgi:hypothetical protein